MPTSMAGVNDVILYYAGQGAVWNRHYQPHRPEYIATAYRHQDELGRYRLVSLYGPANVVRSGKSGQPWRGINPADSGHSWKTPARGQMAKWIQANVIPDYPDAYQTPQDRLDALDEHGLIYWSGNNRPELKAYLDAYAGTAITDNIADIPPIQHKSKERTGYPTQKPLALYEYLSGHPLTETR